MREFTMAFLIDATSVHPKVFEAVPSGLFSAELYLLIAALILTRTFFEVSKCGLSIVTLYPCMR